jgi:hypothetical protein
MEHLIDRNTITTLEARELLNKAGCGNSKQWVRSLYMRKKIEGEVIANRLFLSKKSIQEYIKDRKKEEKLRLKRKSKKKE